MKKLKYIAFLIIALVGGVISCEDESLSPYVEPEGNANGFVQFISKIDNTTLVPSATAFYSQSDVDKVTYFDDALTTPNQSVDFQIQWNSIDKRVAIANIELYLEYDEIYTDSERNPKTAKHGGTSTKSTVPDGKLWKTIPAGTATTPIKITVKGSDVYDVFKDNTFNYGSGAVNIFTNHPYNASFDRSNANTRFKNTRTYTVPGKGTVSLGADVFRLRWRLIAEDGTAYGSWSPSVCTSVVGANCNGGWKINANVFNPIATIALKSGVALQATKTEELTITFDRDIATAPTISLSPAQGTVSAVTGSGKVFKATYTAPAGFTGAVTATISGAVAAGSPPVGGLVQVSKTQVINVDNTAPQGTRAWSTARIGRGQSATLTVTFNEALSTAAKDSVYVSISGQGIDAITNRKLTLASTGLSGTFLYIYKDSSLPTDVTSGGLTITYGGGKDVAGNALDLTTLAAGGLSTDVSALNPTTLAVTVATPNAPTLTLPADFDQKTQLKWKYDVTGPGSTTGTVFYVILEAGTVLPSTFQRTLDVQGVKVFNGYDLTGIASAKVIAQGTAGIAVSGGTTGTVFTSFTPNGIYDVYAYWVTNTGNASPVSANLGPLTTTP